MSDSDPTPRFGNDAPIMLEPDLRRRHSRTPPLGVPILIEDRPSRRNRSDTSDQIRAAQEAASGATALAENLNRELQPYRLAARSAKRWAWGALAGASGALLAVVASLRTAAHDEGAASERARALEAEVRRQGAEILYLRARLDGQPTPSPWTAPHRAAPAPAADPAKGPPS